MIAVIAPCAFAQPYDFTAADVLLTNELPNLNNHVAVIVRQDGHELYRFQAGDIDYDTKNRLASFTKTISAGVILALRDEGLLTLDERWGDTLLLFDSNGIGEPTILDAWAMRHGVDTPIPYERDARFTLAESVVRIGLTGGVYFEHGTQLGYDGLGMQTTGRIAEIRTNQAWGDIARSRIFDRCDMPDADYLQFDPNPAVAGGLRSSAEETMNFAQMILDNGWYAGERVLSAESIELMFTNNTRDLPVYVSPWPETHPLYPYGVDPDYAFGAWVLAENPDTQHVEEIVGAGAWGSYLWIDQRRGLTAVLITDVQPGSQSSMNAALGLCQIARQQVESAQAQSLVATREGPDVRLDWQPAQDSVGTRIYGAPWPIRDIYDLRAAAFLAEVDGDEALVNDFKYYAVTATFAELENTALIPGGNALDAAVPCRGDLDGDYDVAVADLLELIAQWGEPGPADLNGSGFVETTDLLLLLAAWGPCP
jgi:CubicO group peptidase (beta-lactamase class C family)